MLLALTALLRPVLRPVSLALVPLLAKPNEARDHDHNLPKGYGMRRRTFGS